MGTNEFRAMQYVCGSFLKLQLLSIRVLALTQRLKKTPMVIGREFEVSLGMCYEVI